MEVNLKTIGIVLVVLFLLSLTPVGRRLKNHLGAVKTGTPPEGASINCSDEPKKLFRYTKGIVRWYPGTVVAASWDSNWLKASDIYDCSKFPRGPPMQQKGQPEPLPKEGETILNLSDFKSGTLYRYEGGYIRKYPTTEIAKSWDSSTDFKKCLVYDCTLIPKGSDMSAKPGDSPNNTTSSSSSCFHKDTLVLTPTGSKPMSSLAVGDDIVSCHSSGEFVRDKVAYLHHPHNSIRATFTKLETPKGHITLTPDHILCVNDVHTLRMAKDVHVGDHLVNCTGSRDVVTRVSYIEDCGVYDLLPCEGSLLVTNSYLSSPQCGNNLAMLAALHLNLVPRVTRILSQVVRCCV